MEKVEVKNTGFSRKLLVYAGIFLVYFLAGAAFFYFGFQPATSAEAVYAEESKNAADHLSISSINLGVPVAEINLNGSDLEVPEQIVGAYSVHKNKTLLIAHSTTAFKNLDQLQEGALVSYNRVNYKVTNIETKEKSEISMQEILSAAKTPTLVLMTCAGEQISDTDFSHRLIAAAEKL